MHFVLPAGFQSRKVSAEQWSCPEWAARGAAAGIDGIIRPHPGGRGGSLCFLSAPLLQWTLCIVHVEAGFQTPLRETNLLLYECGKKKTVLLCVLIRSAGHSGHRLFTGLTQSHCHEWALKEVRFQELLNCSWVWLSLFAALFALFPVSQTLILLH